MSLCVKVAMYGVLNAAEIPLPHRIGKSGTVHIELVSLLSPPAELQW